MANTPRATSLYLPRTNYGTQSEINFYQTPSEVSTVNTQVVRSLSPEDVQKLKYKIELGMTTKKKKTPRFFYVFFIIF